MGTTHFNYINNPDGVRNTVIVLPTCKGTIVIPVQQIVRIQSISNYSKLFFSDGKSLVVTKVLLWFQQQFALSSFVRVHRTHFINIRYIRNYKSKPGLLWLQSGVTILVARRKKAILAERLNSLNNSFAHESADKILFNTKKIMAA